MDCLDEFALDMILIDYIFEGMEKGKDRDELMRVVKEISPEAHFTRNTTAFKNIWSVSSKLLEKEARFRDVLYSWLGKAEHQVRKLYSNIALRVRLEYIVNQCKMLQKYESRVKELFTQDASKELKNY